MKARECEKGRKNAKDIMDKKEKALGKKESEVHDGIGWKMRKRGWAAFMVVTSWKPFPSSLAFYGPFSLCHRWKKHEWTELGVCGLFFLAGNWLLCVFTTQVVRRKVIDKFLGPDVSFWPCVSWAWGCVKMNAFSKLKKNRQWRWLKLVRWSFWGLRVRISRSWP